MCEDEKYCHKEAALMVPSATDRLFLSLRLRPHQPLAGTHTLTGKESQDLAMNIEMRLTCHAF